ncbi:5-formyltetrahydrofolate cyclo-ligase [Bacillus oleivorans]|uniref:5-formyltetrahydrofolate cyclo-ligase n=1 Tax=Bacillus oleivorans TaxID=1448271 RepID=A0A285CK22_9BACI|nr:5-formyltetrahydrofolate cyclo-ligase [Bacillus oleivorans]SNX67922.1 5-formyltetrahydrofolate cyclo-ligase [Bacillus oleivorans]
MDKTKELIRKEMKTCLKQLTKPVYEQKSYSIAETLIKQPDWKNAQTIGITLSVFPEVDTYFIIKQAWLEKKQVAVPRCIVQRRHLDFRLLCSFTQLENVYIHLWEPQPAATESIEKKEIDLLIVPGLAFSLSGYRIGFGGGYYDRYLVDFPGKTLSLAFKEQLMDSIPADPYDRKIQQIVTEGTIIQTDRE